MILSYTVETGTEINVKLCSAHEFFGIPRDADADAVILYVVFVWIFVNQRFRLSVIIVTLDRAVSLCF